VVHDPALDASYPAGRPCRVTIELADGSARTASRALPRGDHEHPATAHELRAKFLALTAPQAGDAREDVLRAVLELESCRHLPALTARLSEPARQSA